LLIVKQKDGVIICEKKKEKIRDFIKKDLANNLDIFSSFNIKLKLKAIDYVLRKRAFK
jgi:hypothetical protein